MSEQGVFWGAIMSSSVLLFLSEEQIDDLSAYAQERDLDLFTAAYELIDSSFKSKTLPTAIKGPFEVPETLYSTH